MNIDTQLLSFILNIILKEIKKAEFKLEVFRPLVKSVLWFLFPYLCIFICINVFFMVAAVSFILYFMKKQ